ncbi:helix-turn-helix transcriptional regulator [Companilactobacillus zhachilii]|jgi:transcriptional regulator with XRE-family HTH domain|uniref:helix-turn-helix transcriptional regulator n=1 Tax=Companilactobacillus zhachilii TaxID=2304606 RepID=UPI001922F9F4|nr:helix-turn-helix transcriptional regulator [Companilactobacillus zhachilii]MBL3530777.1 helix-turn-helix transcriptional regulator [Companilactobacillus zhachilii]
MKVNSSKLFELRASKGYTLEELAKKSNVTVRTIINLEQSHTNGNAVTIGKIAKGLDTNVKEICS